jgi:3-hydroxyisobutyrate dehydrogenase-like beta-hydroxyacid dehydrogenase
VSVYRMSECARSLSPLSAYAPVVVVEPETQIRPYGPTPPTSLRLYVSAPAFLPRPGGKRCAAFVMLYPPVPISFLGIGLMGKPMAMNLIKSGYALTVWNRTLSKAAELMSAGARLAKSPSDAVRHAEAVVNAMGNVTHVGPHGRGQLCKLVNQCIVAVTIGAVAEGLTLAKAGGADAAQVRKAISGGFCESRILALHGQRMIDRNFVPGGFIKNQIKDAESGT